MPKRLTFSLISHTNAGKTTLARTLLRKDIGEVSDQPHVTDISEAHELITTKQGDELLLWDTPGFGDTARLLDRLRSQSNPIGWLLAQVWDRFKNRPLWCSQQAVKNVREEADVVLYLVNAGETPESAGYVAAEMEILEWIGKPVLVLLNQVGQPAPERDTAEIDQWKSLLAEHESVREVLSLDAFARCWIEEAVLLDAVRPFIAGEKKEAYDRLIQAWQERNNDVFKQSMQVLAKQLAAAACAKKSLGARTWETRIRNTLTRIGELGEGRLSEREQAMAALAEDLDADIRSSTTRLIELHELEGTSSSEILQRIRENYAETESVDEGIAALLTGAVSGALGGLAADIAAGGLSFGGGAIVGGILGLAGGGAAARGYNLVRGEEQPQVRWSLKFLQGLFRSALLRYLAVAHYGRGRGAWRRSESPPHWLEAVNSVVEGEARNVEAIWKHGRDASPEKLIPETQRLLIRCALRLLAKLHPNGAPYLPEYS